jgi:hypothetical protein
MMPHQPILVSVAMIHNQVLMKNHLMPSHLMLA